ncbi:MAG: hypothetical protein J7L47_02780, partial [Candidatus Odinarchaeota archaeon]|nr:hypothetical protein [Candidatus Odinarchaeota archaeon]
VYMLFTYLILLTPVLALILPIYILQSRNLKILVFGAIYGITIYVLLGIYGMYSSVFDAFIANYHASFISAVKTPFIVAGSFIQGVYGAVVDSSIIKHYRKRKSRRKKVKKK